MLYRDDHEAALLRIESLERENDKLAQENARLRGAPPRSSRPALAPRPAPNQQRPQPRPKTDTQEWIIGGVVMAVIYALSVCTP